MAKCPDCKEEVSTPDKAFNNAVFYVEAYTCKACGAKFKNMGYWILTGTENSAFIRYNRF